MRYISPVHYGLMKNLVTLRQTQLLAYLSCISLLIGTDWRDQNQLSFFLLMPFIYLSCKRMHWLHTQGSKVLYLEVKGDFRYLFWNWMKDSYKVSKFKGKNFLLLKTKKTLIKQIFLELFVKALLEEKIIWIELNSLAKEKSDSREREVKISRRERESE